MRITCLRRLAVASATGIAVAGLVGPGPVAAAASAPGGRLGPPNTWAPAGSMGVARSGQTATLLPGGKVLIAGGFDGEPGSGGKLATAELYDPATRTFSATGRMPVAVADATATLLPDGKVLVAGGLDAQTVFGRPVAAAELYNPATGTWAVTGSMHEARAGDTATLLTDGQVLVAGGRCNTRGYYACTPGDYARSLASAELYNPATGKWTLTGSMHTGRAYDAAVLLRDGKVLVAGGQVYCTDGVCEDTRSAELYDPATGTWAATGAMHQTREQFSATLLGNGEVLVAGGADVSGLSGFSTEKHAELYNPGTGTWRRTASMNAEHTGQTATLLGNGWVLVAGGDTAPAAGGTGESNGSSRVAEIYVPQRDVWVLPQAMTTARDGQTATLLPGGHVLVTGGVGVDGRSTATAEEFLAGNGPLVSITPGSVAFAGQQVGTTSGARSYLVTNEGSANLTASGVALTGRNPADFHAATDCGQAPVRPGASCTVSVRFGPHLTGLRSAVATLYDNAPRAPQGVALSGYGGGPNAWIPVGPMTTARDQFTATLLRTGKVLVAGGAGPGGSVPALASAELYNPATRSFSPTGSLHTARYLAAAALLRTGQVLVAGGSASGLSGDLASAELYNPATGTWGVTTPMHEVGFGPTATLLRNGNVLVAGLGVGDKAGHGAEVYDPASKTWTDTGPMTAPQFLGTATLLPDGDVLAVGGSTSAAELYDPATNRWTATGSLSSYRQQPTATLLPDGEVLVAGGSSGGGYYHALATSELYNPATGTWSLTKSTMGTGRMNATATLLPDGSVLEAGGCAAMCNGPALSSTEQWTRPYWVRNTAMTQPRVNAVATPLPGGDVLVAGGDSNGAGGRLSTAELFMPVLILLHPHRGPAGSQVSVAGSGFYAHETVKVIWGNFDVIGQAVTSAAGTFTTKVTIPATAKPGPHLVLGDGVRSGGYGQAVTTFTVTG
jgi:hypothetical protein